MKRVILPVAFLLVAACLGTLAIHSAPTAAAKDAESRKLRHIVMFQFKETSTPEQVKGVVDAFAALPSKIDSITGFERGTNNSPEKLNDGFTHCFTVTFDSEEGRAAYLPHPAHKAFVEVLKPHLEKVLVFDYWTE